MKERKSFFDKLIKGGTLKTLNTSLVETSNASSKKIKIGRPDLIMGIYTVASILSRTLLPPILLKSFNQTSTMEITYIVSLSLAIIFIVISDLGKLDWRGRKHSSIIAYLVNLLLKKGKWGYYSLCSGFFLFDSFLLYIYSKNGTKSILRILLSGLLLLLSLAWSSFIWMKYGTIF